MEPEEVLELIGSASERFDTVRAAMRYRADGTAQRAIRERIVRTEGGRRAFRVSPQEAAEALGRPEAEGLDTIIRGVQMALQDDEILTRHTDTLYDGLYAYLRREVL